MLLFVSISAQYENSWASSTGLQEDWQRSSSSCQGKHFLPVAFSTHTLVHLTSCLKIKRKKPHHHSITAATSIHQGKQQRQGNTGRKCLYTHRNSQENQLQKRQKTSKSQPALLTPHLQLQTSQNFISAWCRCQNFVLAAMQGFWSLRTEGQQGG